MSVCWADPEQTTGKKFPYMYSKGETILNRDLFPTQDTPDVKTPFSVSITVEKPLLGLYIGIYQGNSFSSFIASSISNLILLNAFLFFFLSY